MQGTSEVPLGPDTGAGLGLTGCGVQTWLNLPTVCVTLGKVLPLSGFSFLICKVGP